MKVSVSKRCQCTLLIYYTLKSTNNHWEWDFRFGNWDLDQISWPSQKHSVALKWSISKSECYGCSIIPQTYPASIFLTFSIVWFFFFLILTWIHLDLLLCLHTIMSQGQTMCATIVRCILSSTAKINVHYLLLQTRNQKFTSGTCFMNLILP